MTDLKIGSLPQTRAWITRLLTSRPTETCGAVASTSTSPISHTYLAEPTVFACPVCCLPVPVAVQDSITLPSTKHPAPCFLPSRPISGRSTGTPPWVGIESSHLLPSSRHLTGIPNPRHLHHRPKAAPSTIVLFQNNHSNTCAPILLFPLRPAHSEISPVNRHRPHQLRAHHHPTTPSMPLRPPR